MAAGLQGLLGSTAAEAAARKPAVNIPEAWNGLRGDTSVEGVLEEFDCTATPPRMHVRGAAGPLELQVAQPNRIAITGTGAVQHNFTCGQQQVRVRVQYLVATGELTAVEFR